MTTDRETTPTPVDPTPPDLPPGEQYRRLLDRLGEQSPKLAAAFMDVAPSVAHRIGSEHLYEWASWGRRLASGGWSRLNLATRFFERGPALFDVLSFDDTGALVVAIERLSEQAHEIASTYVRDAPSVLARVERSDRSALVELLAAISERCPADSDRCFEGAADLLEPLDPQVRTPLLRIATGTVLESGPGGFARFAEAAQSIAGLDPALQQELVADATEIAATHPAVALEALRSAPEVAERLPPAAARRWRAVGRDLLDDPSGGERAGSWFRVESAQARELLAELAGRVELADVAGLLRLYAQALAGEEMVVQPVGVLTGRGIGWTTSTRATTDGTSIFLPASIDVFGDHDANFNAYKVHTTLQAARLSFGSFDFEMGLDGAILACNGGPGPSDRDGRAPGTAITAFYSCFEDRHLISWLFALAEGTRIDACVEREYPGVRRWLHRLQDDAATTRPDRPRMPARQAFAECLVLASLHRADLIDARGELADTRLLPAMSEALELVELARRPEATVQDSAEVAARLYAIATSIPNVLPQPTGRRVEPGTVSDGAEIPFESPEQPEFRGDYQPELVQTIDLLEQGRAGDDSAALDREELIDALSDAVGAELDGSPPDRGLLEELFDNLQREAASRSAEEDSEPDETDYDGIEAAAVEAGDQPGEQEISWFHYDEWDFRAHDYMVGHCRLGERRAAEGELDVYDDVLKRHHRLVVETRRRFEQLRPEAFKRINRLEDGSDIDLDEAIAFHADKLAGAGPIARFYTRRNKIVRDVAVALLLDMSASTREPAADDSKRVIDVVREATVLMIEALEATGDAYGIYGFSGQGHHDVELHVLKDLREPLDDSARRRVAAIEPISSTRMGPAIRHTIATLDEYPAKVKILILVSDGRPEDDDYGPERGEIDYALHDTKRALVEAKRRHIEPFLITVDSDGNDYLAQMCGDLGYEVVADVESLPRRLPRLYRYLTAE